jgi:signal transduction histidine kinase/ActR/RegA family two-component response regulator
VRTGSPGPTEGVDGELDSLARLRDSEARYRSLFETMVEAFLLCDVERDVSGRVVDFRFVAVNKVAADMLHRSRAELEGKLRSELTPPDPETTRMIIEVMETGRTLRRERYSSVFDCWLLVVVFPQGGDRIAILASDITEQKRGERQQAFLLRLNDVLRPLADPIAIQAATTALLREHFDVARSYYTEIDEDTEVGYVHAESAGPDAPSGLGRYDLRELREVVAGLRRGPVVRDDWQDARVSGGLARTLAARKIRAQIAVPLIKQGKVVGTLAVSDMGPRHWSEDDVALVAEVAERTWAAVERARAEEAVRKSEQLARRHLGEASEARAQAEAANRAKDEFLATMSHELRTPLHSILGWATLLRQQPHDERRLDHGLEVIERNAKAQERLITELLDVSRIVTGKLALTLARTTLWDVVHAAAEVVRPAAESKGVRLLVDVDPDLPALLADSARLQQVVWNLLINAVRFTPHGGKVTIDAEREDSKVYLRVRDTGSGIAAEHLPHVFERFRQVDSSITRSHGGLGLGLAIVRHIVEGHGGAVEADSDGIGRGATFTIMLPIRAIDTTAQAADAEQAAQTKAGEGEGQGQAQAAEQADTEASRTPAPRQSLEGMRILLVEDDLDSLELIQQVLAHAGAKVTAVGSGSAALAAHGPFDVIMSDIGMPEMDGYALLQRIRSQESGGGVPAIALTAYARAEDAERARSAGYQEHLPKPIEPSKLVAALATWRPRKPTTPVS